MRERQLRRRCRRLLRELDIRPPLNVTDLCGAVGAQRGRPIRLVAHPLPMPGPFGVWTAGRDVDYILFQQETSKAHQDHIILHELGHILAGHDSDEQDDELLRAIYPDLDPEVVRRALRRTSYDTEREREAETVATIILEWASVVNHVAPRSTDVPATQAMGTALTDRLGWL